MDNSNISNCSGLLSNNSANTLGYSGLVSSGTGVLSGWSSSTPNPYTMQGTTGTNISSGPYIGCGGISTLATPPTLEFNSSGMTLAPNATLQYLTNTSKNMAPRQVHVAVFTITRDVDTNEINSTKFVKELWIEQKNGTSIDLLVAKQLDKDFDPEFTIIKVLATVSF
jgi:hypothetical protein